MAMGAVVKKALGSGEKGCPSPQVLGVYIL
jgi:hypothetical protein